MIIKEGYLKKLVTSRGIYRRFEKKWVVLEASVLTCFKSKKKSDIAHVIDICDIIDVTTTSSMARFQLIRSDTKENITFVAKTTFQMTEWMAFIQNTINSQLPPIYRKQRSISAAAATTKDAENKTLKKQNKRLERKVHLLKQKVDKLTEELRDFREKAKNKYRVWIDKHVHEEERERRRVHNANYNGIDKTSNIRFPKKRRSSKQRRKLLGTPLLPYKGIVNISPNSSDNEFEIDLLSATGTATKVDTLLSDHICDIFNRSKSVNESMSIKRLLNEKILYDSPMKVYSTSNDAYVDTAGVLTKKKLYLTSAINYRIWSELRQRTKIDELISDENDNNSIIKEGKAQQMMQNLDITDDETSALAIKNTFIGKTKREIKLNILFNERPIKSLASLFGLNPMCCKQVHCVIMNGFYDTNIVAHDERDTFIENIFENIAWVQQQQMNDSIVITLRGYLAASMIETMNVRKEKYLAAKGVDSKLITIEEYDDKVKYTQYETSVLDIKALDTVHLFGNIGDDKGFAFVLKSSNNDDIRCLLHSNNVCHEWIAHLDFAMLDTSSKSYKTSKAVNKSNDSSKDKLMNDFTNDEVHFGFGVYLNYWQNGFDNTVIPKHDTLKQELLQNAIAKISEQEYYELYEACAALLKIKRHEIQAKEIGINNKTFNIKAGEDITINHLIALKLYTDYAETSHLFKRTMRKKDRNETMEELIVRNSEVALWSRYIKESCMFYGNILPANTKLYTGLKQKLWFSSMKQHFECPVSTTLCHNKAFGFCEDDGLILKLKAGNSKTRYFDVSWLSRYKEEKERLIMGSSLKICDIYVKGGEDSSQQYIAAILMFEQLMNGHFVNANIKTEKQLAKELQLYALLAHVMKLKAIKESIAGSIVQYNIDLLQNVIKEIKSKYDANELWINNNEIEKIKYKPLKALFKGPFFEFFAMKTANINWVKQYSWNISNKFYDSFKNMPPRKYILSQKYHYESDDKTQITFYFKCCRQYSEESEKCALFFHIDPLPKRIKAIKVEYDLLCKKENRFYRNLILPQWLSNDKLYCGLQAVSSKVLNSADALSWIIGLKVIDVIHH